MTYICIKCGYTWTDGRPTRNFSGGLCDSCITEYIRGRQRKEGLHDCFRRAIEECSEDCKYKTECLRYVRQAS